jgi:hypothetical protein
MPCEVGKKYKLWGYSAVRTCKYVSERGAVFTYGIYDVNHEEYLSNDEMRNRSIIEYHPPVLHKRWVVWWKGSESHVNCSITTVHPNEQKWHYPILHFQEVIYNEVPEGST